MNDKKRIPSIQDKKKYAKYYKKVNEYLLKKLELDFDRYTAFTFTFNYIDC